MSARPIFGKAATAIYVLTGVATLYFNYLRVTSPVVVWLGYLALAITLVSGFDYLRRSTRSLP